MLFHLYFTINKFTITPSANYVIPVSNRNYVYANFTFSNEWDTLYPIAIFVRDDVALAVPIEFDIGAGTKRCMIPMEIMAEEGRVDVGVIAGDRAVSIAANFMIGPSIYQDTEPAEPPPPSYQYVMTPSANAMSLIRIFGGQFQYFGEGTWHTIAIGPQGVQGETGPQGEQGLQGVTGPQGTPGPGITFQGNVPSYEYLPPIANQGDAFFVENEQMVYVWGTTGFPSQGNGMNIQGIQGIQGEQGLKGDTGERGPDGIQGPKGEQGLIGPIGPQGVEGLNTWITITELSLTGGSVDVLISPVNGRVLQAGDLVISVNIRSAGILHTVTTPGVPGIANTMSTFVGNIKGPQGETGPQGIQGYQGPQGNIGPIGPAGQNGSEGLSIWITTTELATSGNTSYVNVVNVDGRTLQNGDLVISNNANSLGIFHMIVSAGTLGVANTTTTYVGNLKGPQGPKGDTGPPGSDVSLIYPNFYRLETDAPNTYPVGISIFFFHTEFQAGSGFAGQLYGTVYTIRDTGNHGSCLQYVFDIGASYPIYMRRGIYPGTSWSEWRYIFDSSQKISIINGGTGANNAMAARTNLDLGNVDNTSDNIKLVKGLQQQDSRTGQGVIVNPVDSSFVNGGITANFFYNSEIGLYDGGVYSRVLTYRAWTDPSGGVSIQLAFTDNGNIWRRNSTSATEWGAWNFVGPEKHNVAKNPAAFLYFGGMTDLGIKITLPYLANAGKMVAFTVRMYAQYECVDIQFSGYLYSAINQWLSPKAIMIAGTRAVRVVMGRDLNGYTYVWISGPSSYAGVAVLDVVGGYSYAEWNGDWQITSTDTIENIALDKDVYPTFDAGGLSQGTIPADRVPTLNQNTTGSAGSVIDKGAIEDRYRDFEVSKYLRWKNYGNNHVIIDASNGTAPNGAVINHTNPSNAWSGAYPTLMGWNGNATYGVRVDSARNADTVAGLPVNEGRNNVANQIVRTDVNGYIQAGYINTSAGIEDHLPVTNIFYEQANDGYMRKASLARVISQLNSAGGTTGSFVAGYYIGNGTTSRTITLGFTPSAVLVVIAYMVNTTVQFNFAANLTFDYLSVVTNGFTVYNNTYGNMNIQNQNYHYIAWR